MKLPNILTLSRLGMAALMMALLTVNFPYSKSLALLVFSIAGITDYFDGYLARNVYGETSFGRLMDPLADKVLVCAAFVSFVAMRLPTRAALPLVPAWIVVIIISREFLVTGLRLLAVSKGKIISAGKWGKHKTIWQIIAIVAILLGQAVREDLLKNASPTLLQNFDLVYGTVALGISIAVVMITVVSGGMYFVQHRNLISEHVRV
ncbi:MAG: CDP-diacylglycerol--glycerol-3-phosphate 3-phosphatidyltransferase [Lentisphaerota bacterium]